MGIALPLLRNTEKAKETHRNRFVRFTTITSPESRENILQQIKENPVETVVGLLNKATKIVVRQKRSRAVTAKSRVILHACAGEAHTTPKHAQGPDRNPKSDQKRM